MADEQLTFEIISRIRDEASAGLNAMSGAVDKATGSLKAMAGTPLDQINRQLQRTTEQMGELGKIKLSGRFAEDLKSVGFEADVSTGRVRQMIREVRLMAGPLVSELSPALGGAAREMANVSR